MRIYSVAGTKEFMNALLKESTFDSFEARGVSLETFTRFDISCVSESAEGGAKIKYCRWGEIKPVVFSLVKGKTLPKLLRIGLCLSGMEAEKAVLNAAALHLTITYENGSVSVLTGSSQKSFTLDNSTDTDWDGFVEQFFSETGIELSENVEK